MGLFKLQMEKPDVKPAIKYSQIEQGMAKEEIVVPAPPPQYSSEAYMVKVDQILANQVTIAENQIMTVEEVRKCMSAIAWIQERIQNLPDEEQEAEPTEEEIQEALQEARKKKAAIVKGKKK